jgi:hypothetical protein
VTKSGIPFPPSVNRFCYTLVAAIFLFELLLVPAVAQEDGKIAGQVRGEDKGGFISGTSMLASEAGIQQPPLANNGHTASSYSASVPAGATECYSVTVHPETGYVIDGSKDGYINATTEYLVADVAPTYHEFKLPQASSTADELGYDYQQGSHHEFNEDFVIPVEDRYTVRYVDREVVKEVLVEKPVEWRQFASLDELEAWLAEDDTDEYVYLFAGKDGVCQPSDKYDCDDYAFQLQERAADSGFLISVTIIKKQGKPHMINLACIGNSIYYIEPQSDEVWFYCNRD